MPMTLLQQLRQLDTLTSALMGGVSVQLQPISGDVPVLQVSIDGRNELPIFITCSDTQIICLCYLWTDQDVRPERRGELLEVMLDLNPSVPLSSFGRIGERFVLTGALARSARAEDVAHEVAVLSDNALDALDALTEFLR
ncbi:YjfI family protein [Ottowia sp.]|uniref:YjfI family protein n=1 Tax=Ottowia sp. TaxID=1898956 RepID=UPI003A8A9547